MQRITQLYRQSSQVIMLCTMILTALVAKLDKHMPAQLMRGSFPPWRSVPLSCVRLFSSTDDNLDFLKCPRPTILLDLDNCPVSIKERLPSLTLRSISASIPFQIFSSNKQDLEDCLPGLSNMMISNRRFVKDGDVEGAIAEQARLWYHRRPQPHVMIMTKDDLGETCAERIVLQSVLQQSVFCGH